MSIPINRKNLLVAFGVGLVLLCLLALNLSLSLKKEVKGLKERRQELLVLKDEILVLKSGVDAVEVKKSLSKVKGIVQAVDEIFLSIGLKQKVKSVKPTATREIKDAVEEEAEVLVEKADMNEVINILYKIETAPFALSMRKATIKTSFENPSYLTITMTIALIRQK
jgi:hypothetical protein